VNEVIGKVINDDTHTKQVLGEREEKQVLKLKVKFLKQGQRKNNIPTF
jgi:hypothetical protein